jgi:hypothetical protein
LHSKRAHFGGRKLVTLRDAALYITKPAEGSTRCRGAAMDQAIAAGISLNR